MQENYSVVIFWNSNKIHIICTTYYLLKLSEIMQ